MSLKRKRRWVPKMTRNTKMVNDYILSARRLYGYCPCLECGEPVHLLSELGPYGEMNKMRPTYEHIVSRSRGGDNSPDNFAVTHWKCNQARNTRDQLESINATQDA